jgi:hypothetical protein
MPDGCKVYSVERQNEFKQTSTLLPKEYSSQTPFFGMVIKDYQVMLLCIIVTAGHHLSRNRYGPIKK